MSPETQALARKYLDEVITSQVLSGMRVSNPTGGPFLKLLERETEEMLGIAHAVAVSSATTGLEAALQAVGVGPGSAVLVSGLTMTASAGAVARLGATPIFVDVDPLTGLITLDTIKEAKESYDSPIPPRALVLVHLFGQVVDTYPIRHAFPELSIIEDCAQAPACVDSVGEFAGAQGEVGVISLNQHKVVQCGEGGICITDDDEIYERLMLIRNHGENYSTDFLGSNFRLTELGAAVAYAEMSELFKRQHDRKAAALHLRDRLLSLEDLRPQVVENPPFMFYALDQGHHAAVPAGWRRGYSTPLCCIPYFKKHYADSCLVGAHVFNASCVACDPPNTIEEAEDRAAQAYVFYKQKVHA